jgi:hypothetical protein
MANPMAIKILPRSGYAEHANACRGSCLGFATEGRPSRREEFRCEGTSAAGVRRSGVCCVAFWYPCYPADGLGDHARARQDKATDLALFDRGSASSNRIVYDIASSVRQASLRLPCSAIRRKSRAPATDIVSLAMIITFFREGHDKSLPTSSSWSLRLPPKIHVLARARGSMSGPAQVPARRVGICRGRPPRPRDRVERQLDATAPSATEGGRDFACGIVGGRPSPGGAIPLMPHSPLPSLQRPPSGHLPAAVERSQSDPAGASGDDRHRHRPRGTVGGDAGFKAALMVSSPRCSCACYRRRRP